MVAWDGIEPPTRAAALPSAMTRRVQAGIIRDGNEAIPPDVIKSDGGLP